MKKATVLLSLLVPGFLLAQSAQVGIGVNAMSYQGDLVPNSWISTDEIRPAANLFIRKPIHEICNLRADILLGTLSGDDAHFTSRVARGFKFSTPFTAATAIAELNLLKPKTTAGLARRFVPYVFVGVGMTFFNPNTDYNTERTAYLADKIEADKKGQKKSAFSTPLGLGVSMPLREKLVLNWETGFFPTVSDFIDGVHQSGNPNRNDWVYRTGLSLAWKFGKAVPSIKDSDKDGLPDKDDDCPNVPGKPENKGCPADQDKDGITDWDDACPDVPGHILNRGCPTDTDNDGIADAADNCPDLAGLAENNGCPADRDADGTYDAQDRCPDEPGLADNAGCPQDTDGDGTPDPADKCPNLPGVAANKGCPDDPDNDGIYAPEDRCPDKPGTRADGGCPPRVDTDKDGIFDDADPCPLVPGTVANKGCPEMKKEEKKAFDLAVSNIEFKPNSEDLTVASLANLEKLVTILTAYPQYQVSIGGHTDSDGDAQANLQLSAKRAETCRQYLLKKGIAEPRLKAEGFGETKPVAGNKTTEGKRKNRRVEFLLNVQ